MMHSESTAQPYARCAYIGAGFGLGLSAAIGALATLTSREDGSLPLTTLALSIVAIAIGVAALVRVLES